MRFPRLWCSVMRAHQHHYGSPTCRTCSARSNLWSSLGATRACSREFQSTTRCGSAGRTPIGETMEVKFTPCPSQSLFPCPCRCPSASALALESTFHCTSGPRVAFLLRPLLISFTFSPIHPHLQSILQANLFFQPHIRPYTQLKCSPFSLSVL